ncbi:MAG: hypothetical protein IJ870_05645 [Alphaproteobacteria bacterium]|nr:hypothetical protein [Alphaproteobacteria bacterium]
MFIRFVFLILFSFFATLPCFAQDRELTVMDADDLNFNITEDAFGNKIEVEEDSAAPVKVDTSRSLSQNLKQNPTIDELTSEVKDTAGAAQSWVKNLFKSNKKSDSIQKLLDENKKKAKARRSNAAVFDISGVMLQMSYQQAEEQLLKRGYKKTTQKMDVPNFIRWRNEEKCRGQGVVGYERLENCIVLLAKKENYYFISQATFNKFDTKETVEIFLSSTFTNNKIYRITYKTEAANMTGNSSKAIYLRNLKVFDFWKKINQKYGTPDNKDDILWGLGSGKPYLQASTGFLKLEDPVLMDLDATRMSREDQRFIHSDIYTF